VYSTLKQLTKIDIGSYFQYCVEGDRVIDNFYRKLSVSDILF